MSFLREAGAVLRLVVTVISVALLAGFLLALLNVGFGFLGFVDQLATSLIGGGALGWYGVFAGVTMVALTGTRVWGMLEFSLERLRTQDLLSALTGILGRGLTRGIPALLQILLGGFVWPITILGWLGLRSDARGREQLQVVREFHALRSEIEKARAAEPGSGPGGAPPGATDTSLPDRHDSGSGAR